MNVFVDLHHFDLFYSFQVLFEKRLGWKLYRPIGYDWKDKGFWALGDGIVKRGYLSTVSGEIERELATFESFSDPSWARYGLELLRIGEIQDLNNGVFSIRDKSKDCWQQGISLEAFKNTRFDIIISTVPHHFELFEKLRQTYQPQAKHIFQSGNKCMLPIGCKNVMISSDLEASRNINLVKYHQEFDLNVFTFNPDEPPRNIYCYVHYPESELLMNEVVKYLPQDYRFSFIGKTLGCVKDMIVNTKELAARIQQSTFTWHIKYGGEGYGHILHNSFACGTPVVTSFSDYQGFCGLDLLIDGETAIDIDNKMLKEIADMMIQMSNPNTRKKVRDRFNEVVDFNKEFEGIKQFLRRLQ